MRIVQFSANEVISQYHRIIQMGTELNASSSISWRSEEIIQNFIQPNLERMMTAQPLCADCSNTRLSPWRFFLHPSSDSAVLHVVTMQHYQGPGSTLITSPQEPRGLLLGPHKDLTSPNKPVLLSFSSQGKCSSPFATTATNGFALSLHHTIQCLYEIQNTEDNYLHLISNHYTQKTN